MRMDGKYPNELVPDERKDMPEYGLSVGKYIESQWFGGDMKYSKRVSYIQDVRKQLKGDIDLKYAYDALGLDVDASKAMIDFSPPRVVAKFINDVVDDMNTKINKVKTFGIDPISNKRRLSFGDTLKKFMVTSGFAKEMDEAVGIKMSPDIEVPADEDEYDLFMKFDYHDASEMVSGDSIKKIMDLNKWETIERDVKEDLVSVGEGGVRVKRNGGQIIYERVMPEYFIYSEDTQNSSDRKGTYYYGHVRKLTVGELKRFASSRGDVLPNEYIRRITGNNNYGLMDDYSMDDDLTVTVIDFAYKTYRHITKKKKFNRKGGFTLVDKESTFKADDKSRYESIQSSYDVWYEGLYPINGDRVIGYKLMDDTPRKRSNLKDTLCPYLYFTLTTESIGKRILPYAKQINIVFLKIQQHVAKQRPDGSAIDISALADIEIADGKILKIEDIIREYNTSGNLLYDGEKLEGEYGNKREPIRDNPAVNSDKIGQLIRLYFHWIQQIRDETGIANTSNPDPNSLVGVQKIAMANAQVSIRHIKLGVLSITHRLAEATLMHLQMMARYKIHATQIANAVGMFNAASLAAFNEIGNLEYDINIQLEPDEEERAKFDRDLNDALRTNPPSITLDEKINIERYSRNLDYAAQLLRIKIKKRRQEMEEMQAKQAQSNSEMEQLKAKLEVQKANQMVQMEIAKHQATIGFETKAKMDLMQFEMDLKMNSGNPDFRERTEMERIKADERIRVEGARQENKNEGQSKAATQNSKMIKQRKEDGEPIDFENESKFSDIIG